MRSLNGIINFSGGEYDAGDGAFSLGDVAVSVTCEPQDADKANVTVKLPGMSAILSDDITINDDGSVTIAGWFSNGGGGGGGENY